MRTSRFHRSCSASGNALFLILIAVALFAALSYAITQSGRGGIPVNKEAIILDAARMVEYTNTIKAAIQRLKLINGCTDKTISFENTVVDGYANPSAPADKSCNVFDPAGGAIAWQDPPSSAEAGAPWLISGFNRIGGLGSIASNDNGITSLVIFLPINSYYMCKQINKALGNPDELAVDWIKDGKFDGNYANEDGNDDSNFIPDDGGNTAGYTGKPQACIQAQGGEYDTNGSYFFYAALIER